MDRSKSRALTLVIALSFAVAACAAWWTAGAGAAGEPCPSTQGLVRDSTTGRCRALTDTSAVGR